MFERPVGKAIPASQFAILKDRERNTVVTSGTFEEISSLAASFNREYQSTAYVAELWNSYD